MTKTLFVAGSENALLAAGVAAAVESVLRAVGKPSAPIILRDGGDHARLDLPADLGPADVAAVTYTFTIGRGALLGSAKERQRLAGKTSGDNFFGYDEQRGLRDAYTKIPAKDRQQAAQQGIVTAPSPDLPLYIAVSHFKAAGAYNDLRLRWLGDGDLTVFRAHLAYLLQAFGALPNPLDEAQAAWEAAIKARGLAPDAETTLLQIVNPVSGKGANATKASGLRTGNLDGFWLLELLKFTGFFALAAPVRFKSKDRKTYTLRPTRVPSDALAALMDQFRKVFFATTSVKTDVLAALLFTQTFVQYCKRALEALEPNPLLAFFGRLPKVTDIAQGFDVTFSKDMGSAFATMNLATINLPGWLAPAATVADADAALALLEEHIKVVHAIQNAKREEGAEEYDLLRRYRDFLSGNDLPGFFDFAAHYGDYVLAARHRKRWSVQLTTQGMETLVNQSQPSEKLSPILRDAGFQAIARAIRQATVLAQYHAAREPGYPYEVRYGLGQDLLRAAAYPGTFIAALSTFLQSFNAENARMDERITKGSLRNAHRRQSVQVQHIERIAALIDDYSSEVVCKLLVAYGYARDPKSQPAEQGGASPEPSDEELSTDTNEE